MSQIKGCFFVISLVAHLFKTIKKERKFNFNKKKEKCLIFIDKNENEMREAKKNNIS